MTPKKSQEQDFKSVWTTVEYYYIKLASVVSEDNWKKNITLN